VESYVKKPGRLKKSDEGVRRPTKADNPAQIAASLEDAI